MAMVDDLIEKGSEFSFRGTDDELDVRSAVEASLGYEDLGAAEQDMRIRWPHNSDQRTSRADISYPSSSSRKGCFVASGTADLASMLSARSAAYLDLPGPSEAVRLPDMALTSSGGCSCGRS